LLHVTLHSYQMPKLFLASAIPMSLYLFGLPMVDWLMAPRSAMVASVTMLSAGVLYLAHLAASVRQSSRSTAALVEAKAQAEREREIAQHALELSRESEALYRLLADNQTDVISLWDGQGNRIYSSPSAERAFGYTPEEMKALPKAANLHPDDIPVMRALLDPLVAGADGKAEYRLLHKDGSAIWVEGCFQRLDDGSNGLLSTTRVITERRKLQQELVKALDDAHAALAVKSDFLANMTHELRTPLNAIIGFSGVLKEDLDLSPRHARQVELIWNASQTLLWVVNDVLDLSKMEAGAIGFETDAFDPTAITHATVSLLSGQASAKGLGMRVEVQGLEGRLLGDGARLRQVLTNFVSNAVKFTAQGEIEVLVSQSPDRDQRRLRVAVKDSGIGVAPDQIDAIFARFTQADASVSRRFGGTGLGLAISKRIIEAMGGDIGVESSLGQGSTFWFEVSLPVAAAACPDEAAAEPSVSVHESLRLLVVDDNPVNRELICTLLEPFDLDIQTAADGVEAIEAVSRAAFDVVLMDVQMPNMDGLAATRCIRDAAAPGARRVPIIAMTANVLPEQVARCLEAGMDDHVGKPIKPSSLLEALVRWSPPDPSVGEDLSGQEASPRPRAAGAR
jgi:PAS domain S-box-containing protein